jgi:hypothetical protein
MTQQQLPDPTPQEIVELERRWVNARAILDELMKIVTHDAPILSKVVGLSDASLLFDFVYSFIIAQHNTGPDAYRTSEIILAAAVTKLARMQLGLDMDMAAFERDAK